MEGRKTVYISPWWAAKLPMLKTTALKVLKTYFHIFVYNPSCFYSKCYLARQIVSGEHKFVAAG